MKNGTLKAALDVSSYRLQRSLPIEVRNSKLALIGTLQDGDSIELAPGLYEVSTVLDDGQRHAELVAVETGAQTDVSFRADAEQLMPRSTRTTRATHEKALGPIPDALTSAASVLETYGAKLTEQAEDSWIFVPTSDPHEVPWVRIDVGGKTRTISLPVNPRGHTPEECACILRFETFADGVEPRAWIHPARKVSSTVQHMVNERRVFRAHSVADDTADDMLQAKYQDPVGAALGAVVMYQAGTLPRRMSWLENLARSFEWMPDGKILLGALWLKHADTQSDGADLLLATIGKRPLFTLSYSVCLDTLRRWPLNSHADEVAAALELAAPRTARVDWNAFTFTTKDD